MADVLRNGLGYFFQGIKDCLYGIVRIYEFQKSAESDNDTQEQKKPLSILAQRRAASATSTSESQKAAKKSR